jgi:hypothetical protein
MSDFEKLLAEIQGAAEETTQLAKSMPDANPEDEDNDLDAGDDKPDAEVDNTDGDKADDKEPIAKSMTTVIDNEEVEVVDATELIKSLTDRMSSNEQVLAKALTATTAALQESHKMIKSMSDRIDQLANQGRGRKTVIVAHEKNTPVDTLAKSQQAEQPTGGQILAKALDAQKLGKITGADVSRAETAINNGVAVPADILARI